LSGDFHINRYGQPAPMIVALDQRPPDLRPIDEVAKMGRSAADPGTAASVIEHIAGLEVDVLKERIAQLEAALHEIEITWDETEQTPTKICAALYAVCRLAGNALKKSAS
jgi:pyridoxal biosynthesis lyase PdxS